MRIVKLLANLGYGSRKEVERMLRAGLFTDRGGAALDAKSKANHGDILFDGEPLDPAAGLLLMLNKPCGYSCTTKDPGRTVYDLLPPRFRLRKPLVAPIGRLDKETSGLLLMTDDGQINHRVSSPKKETPKVYEVALARPLEGHEKGLFEQGGLMLEGEKTPLKPALMEVLGERSARLTLTEGRYHQVRRMFAAVGNHVEALNRSRVGALTLNDLEEGDWRLLSSQELELVFAPSPRQTG